ncbi:MAG TPA: hypothetical protein VKD69_14695 [Vicinamibacterales bacterium]|nr:hypothetical protein [Vicinamibacterales bacterium]
MMRALCCVVLVVLVTTAAAAADEGPLHRAIRTVQPSEVEVLLAAQAVLHTADMITTSYDLSLDRGGHEANPLLGPFTRQPIRLVVLSSAVDVLQAYTISKLQHRHPQIALWWARALAGVEAWSTINNINAAGELQRGRALAVH